MESILETIKKMIGLEKDYTVYDEDIIVYINSAFATLNQISYEKKDGFMITDYSSLWNDYTSNLKLQPLVKSYIYLKVKTVFDPPQSSFVLDAQNKQIQELEWRITILNPTVGDVEEELNNVDL